MGEVKVALGSGWRNYGADWIHVDNGDYEHLDFKIDIKNIDIFEDNSIDVIYASHVLEYFDREEVYNILSNWKKKLVVGGKLYISVPDFEVMAKLYVDKNIPLHRFLGPIYGKMKLGTDNIFHKTIYDYSSLGELLKFIGMHRVERYNVGDLIGDIDDHSKAMVDGNMISLNLVCTK
jgi:predicted SAM-dependent methyltransferase